MELEMRRMARGCLLTFTVMAAGCNSDGAKPDGASSKPVATAVITASKSADAKAPTASASSTDAPSAASSASAEAGPVVVVTATDLAKEGATLAFGELSKKYGGKRLEVTGKVKDERGDLVLEAAPKNVFVAFEGSGADEAKGLVGKTATVQCAYGGTANQAVNLRDCTLTK
jgi:hypothetical protein